MNAIGYGVLSWNDHFVRGERGNEKWVSKNFPISAESCRKGR